MIPIACIHGALRSRLGMWPTASFFRLRGHPCRTFGYHTRRGTLMSHGDRLAQFWREWYPDPPPVVGVFAHSMGGLVTRAWLSGALAMGQEQRIVMLSPPNRGSLLAQTLRDRPWFRLIYGDACAQLQRETADALPPLPASARVLILAGCTGGRGYNRRIDGDNDGVVAVSEMELAGAALHRVHSVHSVLQWRPEILDVASRFFATGEPPQEQECRVSR